MIDDDDVDFAILAGPGSGPGWYVALWLLLIVGLAAVAINNDEECTQRKCQAGQLARLLDHECVCVSEPQ